MKLVITDKHKDRVNKLFEWLLYLIGYTIIFILITNLFKSVYIDTKHTYIYSVLVVVILSILNSTIKPILVTLTLPIIGITFGIFYPFINLFLLKLADWILGPHFQLENIYIAFFVALLLSIINFIIEHLVIKPIIKGVKNHGKNSV